MGFKYGVHRKVNLVDIKNDAGVKALRAGLQILQDNINSEYRTLNKKQNTLKFDERQEVWTRINEKGQRLRQKLRRTHKNKLEVPVFQKSKSRNKNRAKLSPLKKTDTRYQEPINISSGDITESQKSLMKKGPSFVQPPNMSIGFLSVLVWTNLLVSLGIDTYVAK